MRKLKELRDAKGVTQTVLADSIGVSRFTIISYENGGTYPTLDVAQKIADFFNCSIDDLLNPTQPSQP